MLPYVTASWLASSRRNTEPLWPPLLLVLGCHHQTSGFPDRYLSLASHILLDNVSQAGSNCLCLGMFWQAQNTHTQSQMECVAGVERGAKG